MGVYSMLTDTGLSKINQAYSETGILIDITYWVAGFDEKLDADYKAGLPASTNIANYTSNGDTYINKSHPNAGDVTYWNLIKDDSPISPPTDVTTPNASSLYPNVSYSPACDSEKVNYVGTWDPSTSGDEYPPETVAGNFWTVVGTASIVQNILYSPGDELVYNGTAFKNTSGEDCRGNFNITVSNNGSYGVMKVNKLGLYAIVRSSDGVIQTQPFLLGQVIIPNTQEVAPRSEGSFTVDQITVDFQIDAQAAITEFDNIMYASENDYWNRVTNSNGQYGLQYDGSVYITNRLGLEDITGNTSSDDDVGVAKTLITTFESVNKPNPTEEKDLPQLMLQYVKSTNFTGGNTFSPRVRTSLSTRPTGDMEVNMYGSCSNKFGYYAVVPKTDRLFGLGNNDNRWKLLKTSDRVETYLGVKYDGDDITVENVSGEEIPQGVYVYQTTDSSGNPAVNPDTGNILVNTADQTEKTVGYAKANIPWSTEPADRTGEVVSRRDARWDYIETDSAYGYMMMRNNDLSVNQFAGIGYFGNASTIVGPHFDDRSGFVFDNNYYYNYGNISNFRSVTKSLDGKTSKYSAPLAIRSTENLAMYTISEDYMSTNEFGTGSNDGTDSNTIVTDIGRMVIGGQRKPADTDENAYVQRVVADNTIFKTFYSKAVWTNPTGLNNGITLKSVNELRQSIFGQVNVSDLTIGGNGIGHDLMIASSRYIFTNGDIVPMIDGFNNLGTKQQVFRDVHARRIVGDWVDGIYGEYPRHLMLQGNFYPDNDGFSVAGEEETTGRTDDSYIIGRDPRTGIRWYEINSYQLGNDLAEDNRDWIDTGYIRNVRSENMYVSKEINVNNTLSITDEKITSTRQVSSTDGSHNVALFDIGTEDVYINNVYVDNLFIRRIKGLDLTTKVTTIIVDVLSSDVGFQVNDITSVDLSGGTLIADITYGVSTGIESINLSFGWQVAMRIDSDSNLGDAKGASGNFVLNGLFTKLLTAMVSDPLFADIDVPAFFTGALGSTNTTTSKNATGSQTVQSNDKKSSDNCYYDKKITIDDTVWSGTEFTVDSFNCGARKTNHENLDIGRTLDYSGMKGISLNF